MLAHLHSWHLNVLNRLFVSWRQQLTIHYAWLSSLHLLSLLLLFGLHWVIPQKVFNILFTILFWKVLRKESNHCTLLALDFDVRWRVYHFLLVVGGQAIQAHRVEADQDQGSSDHFLAESAIETVVMFLHSILLLNLLYLTSVNYSSNLFIS